MSAPGAGRAAGASTGHQPDVGRDVDPPPFVKSEPDMTSFGLHQTTDNSLADLRARYGTNLQLPPRREDQSANAGTVGIWDFATPWGAPGGDVPVDTVRTETLIRNLLANGTAARKTDNYGAMTVSGGAVRIAGDTSLLLSTVVWQPGLQLIVWLRSKQLAPRSFNNRLMKVGPMLIIPHGSDNGTCSNFEIDGPSGQRIGGLPDDLRGAISSNEIVQLAMESEDLGSGQHRLKVALNTIVMFEGPAVNAEAGGQAEVAIGARDGAGTIADGGFHRASSIIFRPPS